MSLRASVDAAAAQAQVGRLLALMAALRTPGSGCPWDLAQTFASVAPFAVEEAYEVLDAVERGDLGALREELGDLLLQVVFHARMAEEAGAFRFDDVVAGLCAKLVRRHPHVFGEPGPGGIDAQDVEGIWDAVKRAEAAAKLDAASPSPPGALTGVARALPALMRADKLSRRAAGVGFDWPDRADVVAKVREELAEVEDALRNGPPDAVAEEVGDLLFSVANLARHSGVDPESALRVGNAKFERRFGAMEAQVRARGRAVEDTPLAELEEVWAGVKRREAAGP